MEEITIDLSDKIFIHRDFVEITWERYTNEKALLRYLEEFIDKKRPNSKFRVSKWNGDIMEEVLLEPIKLCLLILNKRIIWFG